MRNRLLILLALIVVVVGCKKSEITGLEATNGLELGAVLQGDDPATTKATTASPLAVGYQFRLYIFPRGETDPTKATTTRTYTIVDAVGTPKMDVGQDQILLAKGFYDTYIVGPLMGVDKAGAPVEVASATGVNVHVGNDLVSSYKELSVVAASNVLTPNPLVHKMAKAEFIMERSASAGYTDLEVLTISVDKQPVGGSFAFNASSGGLVSVGTALETRTYTPTDVSLLATPKTKYRAVDYLFTQPSKELKISTTFNATIAADTKKYQQSGLVTTDIVAGQQYQFLAAPITPVYLLWNLKLVPWTDEVAGVAGVHDRELILSYSGFDAPVTIDGKRYWLDRSGNGHHALMNSNAAHNAAEKYYSCTRVNGFDVPDLGAMQDVTIEIVQSSANGARFTPIRLFDKAGGKATSFHIPWEGWHLYSDFGPSGEDRLGPFSYKVNDRSVFTTTATWQFTRKVNDKTATGVQNTIYHNGVLVTSQVQRYIDLEYSRGWLFHEGAGKLYALRIYRKALTAAELAVNAASDVQRYIQPGIDQTEPGGIVSKAGGVYSVQVGATGPWTVRTTAGLTAAPTSGSGPATVTLTVGANASATVMRNLEAVFTIAAVRFKWSGIQDAAWAWVNTPASKDYAVINGLKWAKGNLIATGNNGCKVGQGTDVGVFFQFGSLVGWTGGSAGDGVGSGASTVLDKAVWPTQMGTVKPGYEWPNADGSNIKTLANCYFNYSVAPWNTGDANTDIGQFDASVPNQGLDFGTLRTGRYANLGVGDACTYYLGHPWRLPTQAENAALVLLAGGWNNSIPRGRWFGPDPTSSVVSVYLMASGSRNASTGWLESHSTAAYISSSSLTPNGKTPAIGFYSGNVSSNDVDSRSRGIPARCVSE